MLIDETLSEAQAAEIELLNRCREEVERAEAHLLAAQAPEAWVDTGIDGADFDTARAASAYTLEKDVAEELLTPLDAETRGRIVDNVLGSYLAERGDETPAAVPKPAVVAAAANDAGRRRQWWQLPMTAVAAVLLTLLYVDLRGSAGTRGDAFHGNVLLSATNRAGSGRREPAETMKIHSRDHVAVLCPVEGRTVDTIRVLAVPDGAGEARPLRSTAVVPSDGRALLKVHADLAPGPWKVFCYAQEPNSGTLRLVGQSATLTVE